MSKLNDIRPIPTVWPIRFKDIKKDPKQQKSSTPSKPPMEDKGEQDDDKPLHHVDEYI